MQAYQLLTGYVKASRSNFDGIRSTGQNYKQPAKDQPKKASSCPRKDWNEKTRKEENDTRGVRELFPSCSCDAYFALKQVVFSTPDIFKVFVILDQFHWFT